MTILRTSDAGATLAPSTRSWNFKIAVFWVVMLSCRLVWAYRRFRGPYCLLHQGDDTSSPSHLHTHRRENYKSYVLKFFVLIDLRKTCSRVCVDLLELYSLALKSNSVVPESNDWLVYCDGRTTASHSHNAFYNSLTFSFHDLHLIPANSW
jgi:hypothetical protein